MSGYLIVNSWERDQNIVRYLIRRISRIFPALIVVVLLTTFVLGPLVTILPLDEYFAGKEVLPYLGNIFLLTYHWLPGVFVDNPYPGAINSSLWTLQYEFFMYLLVPIVFRLGSKVFRKKRVLFPVAAAACFAVSVLGNFISVPDWPHTACTLGSYFFIGGTFCVYKVAGKIDIQWAVVALGLMIAFANHGGVFWNAASLVLLTIFVFAFSFCENPIFGHIFEKNDFSYGLYIYAFPVSQTIVFVLGPSMFAPVVYFAIAEIISFGFALFSWFIVEKPALALGKRITKAMREHSN